MENRRFGSRLFANFHHLLSRVEVGGVVVEWLSHPLVLFLAIVAVSLLLAKGFLYVLTHYVRHWTRHTKTTLDDRLLDAVSLPIYAALLVGGIYAAYRFSFGSAPWLDASGKLGIVLVGAFLFVRLADALLDWYRDDVLAPRRAGTDVTLLISRVLKAVIVVVFAIMALDALGIAVTPLIASLGIAGLAVALAFQDTLSNFFAGVYLTADRPVRVGDFIRLETGQEGRVARIGWRSTFLHTLSDNLIVMPNSKLAQSVVINFSAPRQETTVDLALKVPAGSDLAAVERMVLEEARAVASAFPGAMPESAPVLFFTAWTEAWAEFTVTLKAKSVVDQYGLRHALIKALSARFRREGVGANAISAAAPARGKRSFHRSRRG